MKDLENLIRASHKKEVTSDLLKGLESLEELLKKNHSSIIKYPKLALEIASNKDLEESKKVTLLNVFLRIFFPHDLRIEKIVGGSACYRTLLHEAILQNEKLMVGKLLEYGEDIDQRTSINNNGLSVAAEARHEDMVDFLLQKGLKPINNASQLVSALIGSSPSMVEKIMKLDIDHFKTDPAFSWEKRVLHCALKYADLSLIKKVISQVIKQGYPLEVICDQDPEEKGHRNGLHHLAWTPHPETADLLLYFLELGMDPDIKDANGMTPLETARFTKNEPMIKALEEYFFVRTERELLSLHLKNEVPSFKSDEATQGKSARKVL